MIFELQSLAMRLLAVNNYEQPLKKDEARALPKILSRSLVFGRETSLLTTQPGAWLLQRLYDE